MDAQRHLREAVAILGILGDREAQQTQSLLDSISAHLGPDVTAAT